MALPPDARPLTFITTTNRARALAFYRDVLGLSVTEDHAFAAVLDMGGVPLRLAEVADHQPQPQTVLGWEVTDIRATAAALRAKGVAPVIYDGFDQDGEGIWHAPGGALILWFRDPDGNVLSLTQPA